MALTTAITWFGIIVYIFLGLYLFSRKIKKDLEEDAKNVDEHGYVIEGEK